MKNKTKKRKNLTQDEDRVSTPLQIRTSIAYQIKHPVPYLCLCISLPSSSLSLSKTLILYMEGKSQI